MACSQRKLSILAVVHEGNNFDRNQPIPKRVFNISSRRLQNIILLERACYENAISTSLVAVVGEVVQF